MQAQLISSTEYQSAKMVIVSAIEIDLDSDSVSAISPSWSNDTICTNDDGNEGSFLLKDARIRTLRSIRTVSLNRRREKLRQAGLIVAMALFIGTPVVLYLIFKVHPATKQDSTMGFNQSLEEIGVDECIMNLSSTSNDNETLLPYDIVVQMSGEMGNHLSKLASGVGVALWLHQMYPDRPSQLRIRHQERTNKWIAAVNNLHTCVPSLASVNFSQAQSYEPPPRQYSTKGINSNDQNEIVEDISRLEKLNITFYSDHLSVLDPFMDRYYDVYRRYFSWNTSNPVCCNNNRPTDDEIVLHVRNFVIEMPRKGVAKGYEELSPRDLVEQALDSIPPGSIAIVSRYPEHLDPYVSTLVEAGWNVRVMHNQSSAEDFCFLLQTQRMMIGTVRSTFFWWAAVLSNATLVQAYSIDSPAKQQWAKQHNTSVLESYNFTNTEILNKFQFPLHKSTIGGWTNHSGY